MLLIGVAAAAYCGWFLSLPLWPSQDGPMHLYYVNILRGLLFHRDAGIYPQFYTVKHVLPPYSLYYYLLMAFGSVVPLVVADKLVVCLYAVLFLFGFRYLARALGPSGDAISLLAVVLVLNWPLGMGFVNYCLSTALACWTLGLWCRVAAKPTNAKNGWRLTGFVILCFVVMMTHPVPLLFVLGFSFVELCVRAVKAWRIRERIWAPAVRRDAVAFILAATTLLYVKAFTTSHLTKQFDPEHPTFLSSLHGAFQGIAVFGTVDAFSPHSPLSLLRRGLLFAIFLGSLALGGMHLRRSLQHREWRLTDTWFVLAALLWVAVPVLPPDINSSHLFSSRLMIYAVLAALAGACGSQPWVARGSERRVLGMCAAVSLLVLVATLVRAQNAIAPVARDIARLETNPLPPRGVYLGLLQPGFMKPVWQLTYDPYYWAELRILRRSGSVLYDTPWLDLTIIPLGAQPVMPTGRVDASALENYRLMRQAMMQSTEARQTVFPEITGAMINNGTFAAPGALDPVLASDPTTGHHWACAPDAFITVCEADGRAYPAHP
jgi:hypothetical protein